MKNTTPNTSKILLLAIAIMLFSCQKELHEERIAPAPPSITVPTAQITIAQAKQWLESQQNHSYLNRYPIRWQSARSVPTKTGNRILVYLPGQPTFQHLKQGYRQLSIQRDALTTAITGKILEIIPEVLYFQEKQKVDSQDFSGRILHYDLDYSFQSGSIYAEGKPIGEARPSTPAEKLAYEQNKLNQNGQNTPIKISSFNFEQSTSLPTGPEKTAQMHYIETCNWVQSSYLDAEGIFNVYTERVCSTFSYDDGLNYNDHGINYDPNSYPGGAGATTVPEPSNIPGENSPNTDPKKLVKCFANLSSEGAAFQVKILVVEPLPGTSFNAGPNSFGHVAIQLTKQKGEQHITQVMGYYGSGTGLSKLVSPSTIKDNSDINYHLSASYFVDVANFQKILEYVASPNPNYHFTEFNCAKFAYQAAQAGGIALPNPTTTFGFGGPGGVGSGMSPAGMGAALRAEKAANPNANITQGGGTAPASKGECNEE